MAAGTLMFPASQATAPSLSLRDAHLINAALTLGYVLPLYFTKFTRLSFSKTTGNDGTRTKGASERSRDDPGVIKARLLSVSVSTISSLFLLHYIITAGHNKPLEATGWNATALHLGFSWCKYDLIAYFVTPALFLGPLYGWYLSHGLPYMTRRPLDERTFNWVGIRNYIVGPISEEVVWRSCIVCAYRLAGASNAFMIFFTPVSFGSAHLHHVWETYNLHGRTRQALRHAVLLTLFQFTYTTLFGSHSVFLLLRTSSLFPSTIAHIFCNIMGFPQLQSDLRRFPYRRKQLLFAYFAGILLYIYGMRSWTLRPDSIFWFHGVPRLL